MFNSAYSLEVLYIHKNIVSDKHERGTERPIETNTKLFEIIYGRNIRKLN